MPICTHCTHSVSSLYTVYESAYNLRLEQCPSCKQFADPYVEHDTLTLFIDLILLKRDVYRHLLFNRGLGARKATSKQTAEDEARTVRELDQTRRRWRRGRIYLTLKLGLGLVAIDAFVRWSYLRPPLPASGTSSSSNLDVWTEAAALSFFRVFVGCVAETVAFHLGITVASYVVLSSLTFLKRMFSSKSRPRPGTVGQFHYAQIPLTLLYSSLPKLFLLSLLSLWRPAISTSSDFDGNSHPTGASLINDAFAQGSFRPLASILDDNVLDREWVVRNLFGGMAAGFGLRVVLDCHPIFTSLVILVGWALKTAASALISGWVGGDADRGEAWFAYSIP